MPSLLLYALFPRVKQKELTSFTIICQAVPVLFGILLIPFYIFSHESNFPEYNSNEQKLKELKAEYQVILERLNTLERQSVIGAFDKRTIIELSGDVIRRLQRNMIMFRRV